MARLAIGKEFLAEYAKLDGDTRSAVDTAVAEFARRTHAGPSLETPRDSRDSRIRTIGSDGVWRGVVLAPDGGDTYCLLTVLPQEKVNDFAASCRFGAARASGVLEVRDEEELRLILAHPFAAWRAFLHPSQHEIAYRVSYSGSAQVTGGPGTGETVTVLHRAAFFADTAGQPRLPGPVLLTTFNGNLAESLSAHFDLLIPDAAVRDQIEVLNVDRLAYRIVRQARGTPILADERNLRRRWTAPPQPHPSPRRSARTSGTGHPGPGPAHRTGLPDLRAHRPRPPAHQGPAQPDLASCPAGHRRTQHRQPEHPPAAGQRGHPPAPPGGNAAPTGTSWWTRPRTCTQPSGACSAPPSRPARTTCSSRPTRTSASTTTGSPWPACGISVRGRSRRLSLNYRTTQEILAWAVPLLGTDPVTGLDGEVDSLIGYRSPMHGPRPQHRLTVSRAEEFSLLTERIGSWLSDGLEPHAIGVAARSAALVREAREALQAAGIVTVSLNGRGVPRPFGPARCTR